ncbi:helix-turn-helix transcriptional regulator [Pseudomonas sp. GD03842]|uniref:winged helix-turn-helix transcriptional regulator n=1 Tax=unclassified Pseudomonas TaxID=196821 RepID=UPI000D3A16AC|nr:MULTISPECIES: helix-turn-helix domain-containing protein [unclassified Pseudomonas]MDH0748835.1 helix-turn-helix transcriptional regulator [Pseudomonas sp. GD03842]RAU44066.1 transcriptional regulator [Pseudomonas sp. RIT 409]RAU54811.1 transcriptional regulator [Pseudomonas sp. RIT 412]
METTLTPPPEQVFADVLATRPVLDQIANKWSVLILTVICTRPSRFNAIKRRLGGITHKALTEALRRLERNGLVTRTVITSSPIAVEYAITPLGCSLQKPFSALFEWAVEYQSAVEQAQRAFDTLKAAREEVIETS